MKVTGQRAQTICTHLKTMKVTKIKSNIKLNGKLDYPLASGKYKNAHSHYCERIVKLLTSAFK